MDFRQNLDEQGALSSAPKTGYPDSTVTKLK